MIWAFQERLSDQTPATRDDHREVRVLLCGRQLWMDFRATQADQPALVLDAQNLQPVAMPESWVTRFSAWPAPRMITCRGIQVVALHINTIAEAV